MRNATPLAEIEARPRRAMCGARGGVPLGFSRPCGLACHGLRRAAAANPSPSATLFRGSPSRVRRSLGLAPRPTRKGAPRAPHALRLRRAADRFALLRGFGRRPSAIVALRRGLGVASACRAAPCAALRPRLPPRPFASASAPGARSSSLRSSSCGRSRASPCSLPSRALRGPGFLPGPLPRLAAPPPRRGFPLRASPSGLSKPDFTDLNLNLHL